MLQSKIKESDVNSNKIHVMQNQNKIFKDILDFEFKEVSTDEVYTLNVLLSKILVLEEEVKDLKKSINEYVKTESEVDNLVVKSVDLISKKQATAEADIRDLKKNKEDR